MTIRTDRGRAAFEQAAVAVNVFPLVRQHPLTLAAVLLPDHLHWLVANGTELDEEVDRFKAFSTQRAWAAGWDGPLWQPSFFEGRPGPEADLEPVARYLLANAVAGGLVADWEDYPWAYLHPKLGGRPARSEPTWVPVQDRRRARQRTTGL